MTPHVRAYRFRADPSGAVAGMSGSQERPLNVMPHPDDPGHAARKRLDRDLAAFESERSRKAGPGATSGMGEGYRFLGGVVGGVLGGLGLGWLFDYLVHTAPLGMISGVLIGTGLSIFVAVRGAVRTADDASKAAGPQPSAPDDEDD